MNRSRIWQRNLPAKLASRAPHLLLAVAMTCDADVPSFAWPGRSRDATHAMV